RTIPSHCNPVWDSNFGKDGFRFVPNSASASGRTIALLRKTKPSARRLRESSSLASGCIPSKQLEVCIRNAVSLARMLIFKRSNERQSLVRRFPFNSPVFPSVEWSTHHAAFFHFTPHERGIFETMVFDKKVVHLAFR